MKQQVGLYIVDDEPGMRELLRAILAEDHAVETFADAEACLQRLSEEKPGMMLVDVGLPGMDGYSLCRQVKDNPATSHIPVTFISGHDTIEARLLGYEAGGEDFIVKPFAPDELLSKVKVTLRGFAEWQRLQARASDAEHTAISAMTSLGGLGAVLEFLRKSFACTDGLDLARAILETLGQYGLQGAVQIRLGGTSYSLSPQGSGLPLEESVLDYVSALGRIFEFQKRAAYNFGGVTVMVSNMPVEDAERCGTLRDNLAILAEGADARRQAIEIEEINRRTQLGIGKAVQALQLTLSRLRQSHQHGKVSATNIVIEAQEDMVKSFVKLGLSEGQENFLIDLVKRYIGRILDQVSQGEDIVGLLEELEKNLSTLAA